MVTSAHHSVDSHDDRSDTRERFGVSGLCISAPMGDKEALRRAPCYQRFVAELALMVYEAMGRDGTLPPGWRRPGSKAREHRTEEAAGHGREAV